MRISDWSSDVCSSDLLAVAALLKAQRALMSNRLTSLEGRRDLLWQGIAEINEEIQGLEAQMVSRARQIAIIREEIGTVEHRSEERRGGTEWGSTCRSRWSP